MILLPVKCRTHSCSVIYIPQKSSTFICLNTTSSEALLKFACNTAFFEDSLVVRMEIQKVELRKPKEKTCSNFYPAMCSISLSPQNLS